MNNTKRLAEKLDLPYTELHDGTPAIILRERNGKDFAGSNYDSVTGVGDFEEFCYNRKLDGYCLLFVVVNEMEQLEIKLFHNGEIKEVNPAEPVVLNCQIQKD